MGNACASRTYIYHANPTVITNVTVTKAAAPDSYRATFHVQEAHGLKQKVVAKPEVVFRVGQEVKVNIEGEQRTVVGVLSSKIKDADTLEYRVEVTTTSNNGRKIDKQIINRQLTLR